LKIHAIWAAMAAMVIATSVFAHDHARHQSWSAGEPGDASKPARTIEIVMSEMAYEPWSVEVKRGEQIRFIIRNAGSEDHEFLLATAKENLAHAEMMKKHRHMKHDEPNAVTLAPKQSAELLWKFTKAGTFEYSCLIPNHREYGMTGRVTVR
jgi:uncharacterized cupredoxin-like copper-binding protein